MKSIAARLALWYSVAATLTLACLCVFGYFVLQKNLIHGLDLLIETEFRQIESHLGADYRSLDRQSIDRRIRETTDFASVLFYIDVYDPDSDVLFQSANLHGLSIPDVRGKRKYSANMPAIGDMRVGEFVLKPFDVMVATPLQPVSDLLQMYIQVSIALVTLMLLVSITIGYGLSHIALRPVYIIEETADRIRSDNLSERIPVANIDNELANLARLLNRMFDRLESSFQQTRRFTGDASHELKTPLSLMRLNIERLIVDGGLTPTQEESIHQLHEEAARLNRIIDELLLISRAEAGGVTLDRQPQSPEAFLEGFSQDAHVLVDHLGKRFEYRHVGAGSVSFDAHWLRQVLLNLLSNAIRAAPPGGLIRIDSRIASYRWELAVEDEGVGVPEAELERIFERFVRIGANASDGSGLGLAICRSIVELHEGRIWAQAGAGGKGLRVTIEIDTVDSRQARAARAARRPLFSHQERHTD